MRTFSSIAELKKANKAIEHHWFDAGAMRFFNSRIESDIQQNYFITSEQFDEGYPRLYTLRRALPNGEVETVGEFQGYDCYSDALEARRILAGGGVL